MLRSQRTIQLFLALATALVAFATAAGAASAGTYTVKSCRASTSASIAAWTHTATLGSMGGLPYFFDSGSCVPSGLGLTRRFEANGVAAEASDSWDFHAPSGTWIVSADIRQLATARTPNSVVGLWGVFDDGTSASRAVAFGDAAGGASFGDGVYAFSTSGPKTQALHSMMGCMGGANCSGTWNGQPGAEYVLSSAVISLEDASIPSFSAVNGPGWQSNVPDGVSAISYSAADSGSGIASVDFVVDSAIWNTTQFTCVSGDPLPCGQSRSGTFSLDTSTLAEGQHTIALVARDGSGNASAPQDKRLTITVRRPPANSATSPVSTTSPGAPPTVGNPLQGTIGAWTGTGISYTYQWLRCDAYGRDCVPIQDATTAGYMPTDADIGHALMFCVTATNSGGSTMSCSSPTAPVVASNPPASVSNVAAAKDPALAETPDRGRPNGTPAADKVFLTALANSRSRIQKVKFGKRVPIAGRLVAPDGTPIAGATLSVQTQAAVAGATMAEAAQVITGRDGRFSFLAPPGPSRTVRFGYRAYSADTFFADTTDVRLVVSAGVTMKATPRKVMNRQATTFTGRVMGGPVPQKGVVVDLQVLFRKKWRTFAAPRTNRRGVYRFKYRFMAGAAAWKVRARVRTDSSYPYALGYSARTIKVKVG
jgi:hypothetical protein